MPLGYGGGVCNIDDIRKLFSLGLEKVSINSCSVSNPQLIREASYLFGSQSIVVSMDVKKGMFSKYQVFTHSGIRKTNYDPVKFAIYMAELGAGEILVNSIDRDGTMQGYDLDLIKLVADSVDIPIIACGGAGNVDHLVEGVEYGGASAVAAGSMFVFQGRHRAVLISYPSDVEIRAAFRKSLN